MTWILREEMFYLLQNWHSCSMCQKRWWTGTLADFGKTFRQSGHLRCPTLSNLSSTTTKLTSLRGRPRFRLPVIESKLSSAQLWSFFPDLLYLATFSPLSKRSSSAWLSWNIEQITIKTWFVKQGRKRVVHIKVSQYFTDRQIY